MQCALQSIIWSINSVMIKMTCQSLYQLPVSIQALYITSTNYNTSTTHQHTHFLPTEKVNSVSAILKRKFPNFFSYKIPWQLFFHFVTKFEKTFHLSISHTINFLTFMLFSTYFHVISSNQCALHLHEMNIHSITFYQKLVCYLCLFC
jgi:hypothetical protein